MFSSNIFDICLKIGITREHFPLQERQTGGKLSAEWEGDRCRQVLTIISFGRNHQTFPFPCCDFVSSAGLKFYKKTAQGTLFREFLLLCLFGMRVALLREELFTDANITHGIRC